MRPSMAFRTIDSDSSISESVESPSDFLKSGIEKRTFPDSKLFYSLIFVHINLMLIIDKNLTLK